MNRDVNLCIWKHFVLPALCLAASLQTGAAQPAQVVLKIDLENYVQYWEDSSDATKFGTSPNQTTTTPIVFMSNVHIADVVAVNGKPAKGTFVSRTQLFRYNPSPASGQTIADVARSGGPALVSIEILQPDGTPVGMIMSQMLVAGAPPPGAPASILGGSGVVVGGTGAFLGAVGQCGGGTGSGIRNASYTEDPAKRRLYGGGKGEMIVVLIPMFRPEIRSDAGRPVVVHAEDFSLVTAAKPAKAGEILSLFATGLGPVRASLDPGQPFPTSPLAVVSSPVEVAVNGTPAEVLAAVGSPASVNTYQVNFRMPANTERGMASVQLSAGWIPGSPVAIAVQ